MTPEWYDVYELPPPGNMMGKGEEGRENFKRQGTEIAGNVFDALSPHVPGLGYDAEQAITSLASGVATVTHSSVALNISGGGTITQFSAADLPANAVLFVRNSNSSSVTLQHGSNLRLNGGTNRVLAQNEGIMLRKVANNDGIFQQFA